jgi:hypothetical protein
VRNTRMNWYCTLLNNACKREKFRISATFWKLIALPYLFI